MITAVLYTNYRSRNDRKEIQLFQKEDLSMGFSIRGGLEFGCGIFVSEVLTSSKAAQAGLKVISSTEGREEIIYRVCVAVGWR